MTTISVREYEDRTLLQTQPIIPATNGRRVHETNLQVKYEYILVLNKKQKAKVIPSLGFAASPYYRRYNYVPYITSNYPAKQTNIGVQTFIVPRVNLNMHRRVFFDINIPVCITDTHSEYHKEENPTVPTDSRTVGVGSFSGLPKYFSLRLGVGVKI